MNSSNNQDSNSIVNPGYFESVRTILSDSACLGPEDRTVVFYDTSSLEFYRAFEEFYNFHKLPLVGINLDSNRYGARPLSDIPWLLQEELATYLPTLSLFIAANVSDEFASEVNFRRQLMLDYLIGEMNTRHIHMPGIDQQIITTCFSPDLNRVINMTNRVAELLRRSAKIEVMNQAGTHLEALFFDPDSPAARSRWVALNGRYEQQRCFGNLPEGEVFTCPKFIEGELVVDGVLGAHFTEKYGLLDQTPVTVEIYNSRVSVINCINHQLSDELGRYLHSAVNGERVGEFAFGTNINMTSLVGNLLADEKFPGFHLAFGFPYRDYTGADFDSTIHLDAVIRDTEATCYLFDGSVVKLMKNGVFLI